jgi:hypothetical protein
MINPNVISQHRAPISKSVLSFIFGGGIVEGLSICMKCERREHRMFRAPKLSRVALRLHSSTRLKENGGTDFSLRPTEAR